MNKEEKLLKVKKNCGTIKKLINAMQIILIVAATACLVTICSMAAIKNTVNGFIAENVKNGNGSFTVDQVNAGIFTWSINGLDTLVAQGNYAAVIQIMCLLGLIVCAIMCVIFHFIKKIFISIEQGDSPFTDDVLKKFKVLFIIITLYVLISYGLLQAILAWLILRCVYCIIDYGCAIQTEVDETL